MKWPQRARAKLNDPKVVMGLGFALVALGIDFLRTASDLRLSALETYKTFTPSRVEVMAIVDEQIGIALADEEAPAEGPVCP
jgi:hypothetical protein